MDREWLSTWWGRLLGGVLVACVLAFPIGFGFAVIALKLASDPEGYAILVAAAPTVLLALPWLLAIAPLVQLSPDGPGLMTALVMVAWAFNASIALRGWTLARLLWIAAVLATIQCLLIATWLRWAPATH